MVEHPIHPNRYYQTHPKSIDQGLLSLIFGKNKDHIIIFFLCFIGLIGSFYTLFCLQNSSNNIVSQISTASLINKHADTKKLLSYSVRPNANNEVIFQIASIDIANKSQIHYGDGVVESILSNSILHAYATPGVYNVHISTELNTDNPILTQIKVKID